MWAWVPVAVGLVGGIVLGRRSRRWYCAACGMLLHAHENVCPKCGVQIEGEGPAITHHSEMAEEEDDDELTQAALAAGPHPDEEDETSQLFVDEAISWKPVTIDQIQAPPIIANPMNHETQKIIGTPSTAITSWPTPISVRP
jgi:hypothetical protein